jgi:hypothetical protein
MSINAVGRYGARPRIRSLNSILAHASPILPHVYERSWEGCTVGAQQVDRVVQLVNLSEDPRGRRYSASDRESAFLMWKVAGRRSFTKTADVTGIAVNTLRSWHHEDDWATRADAEDDDARKMAQVALAAKIVDETQKSLDTIIAIRDDKAASTRDRLNAAIYLLGISGVAPVVKAENPALFPQAKDPAPSLPTNLRSLSDDELRTIERSHRPT